MEFLNSAIALLDLIEEHIKPGVELDRPNEQTLQLQLGDEVYLLNVYESLEQLWLSSSKSGAHHFIYRGGTWQTSRGILLSDLLKTEGIITAALG